MHVREGCRSAQKATGHELIQIWAFQKVTAQLEIEWKRFWCSALNSIRKQGEEIPITDIALGKLKHQRLTRCTFFWISNRRRRFLLFTMYGAELCPFSGIVARISWGRARHPSLVTDVSFVKHWSLTNSQMKGRNFTKRMRKEKDFLQSSTPVRFDRREPNGCRKRLSLPLPCFQDSPTAGICQEHGRLWESLRSLGGQASDPK